MAILPGEDPREFEELHSALIEEWAPTGPTEEDAVLNIAIGIWRKRRVQKYLQAKIAVWRAHPENRIYGDANILHILPFAIEAAPHRIEWLFAQLSPHYANHLRQKCPRQGYESTSAWARAIADEISSVLLPKEERLFSHPSNQILLNDFTAAFPSDDIRHELAVDERIDAMIDRAIKRLVQTKGMKQILDRSPPNEVAHQSKKLKSSTPDGSATVVNIKDRPGG